MKGVTGRGTGPKRGYDRILVGAADRVLGRKCSFWCQELLGSSGPGKKTDRMTKHDTVLSCKKPDPWASSNE